MTRDAVIAMVDRVFDDLAKLDEPSPILLRLVLQVNDESDHSITGAILAHRGEDDRRGFITWGISPYGAGLYSGHYDLYDLDAEADWVIRRARGW